ncbi:Stp1/IreP family PP2C-type Ser/Thr phosphatase, partial [Dysosmobacter welbionis]
PAEIPCGPQLGKAPSKEECTSISCPEPQQEGQRKGGLCQQTESQSQCARQHRKRQQPAVFPAEQPHQQLPQKSNERDAKDNEGQRMIPNPVHSAFPCFHSVFCCQKEKIHFPQTADVLQGSCAHAWSRCSSPDGALFHMEHLPAQKDRQPIIFAAGNEHLSPRDAVENELLPAGIQLTENVIQQQHRVFAGGVLVDFPLRQLQRQSRGAGLTLGRVGFGLPAVDGDDQIVLVGAGEAHPGGPLRPLVGF